MVPSIENSPLALCDGRSLLPDKLIACDRVFCGRLGENYLVQFHGGQKWYWLDRQTSSEPYLFLDWDSEADGGARCKFQEDHLLSYSKYIRVQTVPIQLFRIRALLPTRHLDKVSKPVRL